MVERILIIEDEVPIKTVVDRILSHAGFQMTWAPTGRIAMDFLKTALPDLIILDLILPDISGAEICKHIRRQSETRAVPILILSGDTTAGLPADCLNAGADDFLPKPFDARELEARVHAILRRPRLYMTPEGVIDGGSIRIDSGSRDIVFQGTKIPPLTPKEFNLMKALVTHSPLVLSKAELARLVWADSADLLHPRTLDVHVRRIRMKLGPIAEQGLRTVPAIGYQWVDPIALTHGRSN